MEMPLESKIMQVILKEDKIIVLLKEYIYIYDFADL